MDNLLDGFVEGFVDGQIKAFAIYGFLVFSYNSYMLFYYYLKKNSLKKVYKSTDHEFDKPNAQNYSFDSEEIESSDSEEYFEVNRNLRKRQRNSI
jgi:hypothetical protein